MMTVLTDEGFTGVLGTNCEQTYDRYVRVGEEVTVTTRLESVVGPKVTGVGEGYFVTTRNIWRVPIRRTQRAGRVDAVPGAQVHPASSQRRSSATPRPALGDVASDRRSTATRSSSGRARAPASCGSSSATPAGRSGTRPARPAPQCHAHDRVVRRRVRARHGLLVRRAPAPARPRARAADRARAGRPRGGHPPARRAGGLRAGGGRDRDAGAGRLPAASTTS